MIIRTAREITPGMRVRIPDAVGSYAEFREVADAHPVGIYSQTTISLTDGTVNTWSSRLEFEVSPDSLPQPKLTAGDLAIVTAYALLALVGTR